MENKTSKTASQIEFETLFAKVDQAEVRISRTLSPSKYSELSLLLTGGAEKREEYYAMLLANQGRLKY